MPRGPAPWDSCARPPGLPEPGRGSCGTLLSWRPAAPGLAPWPFPFAVARNRLGGVRLRPHVRRGVQPMIGRKPRPNVRGSGPRPAPPDAARRAEVAGLCRPHPQGRADVKPCVGLAGPAGHRGSSTQRRPRELTGTVAGSLRTEGRTEFFRRAEGKSRCVTLSGNYGLFLHCDFYFNVPISLDFEAGECAGGGNAAVSAPYRPGCCNVAAATAPASGLRVSPPSPRESPGSQSGAPTLTERNGPSYRNRL